ncbi:MAG TPA: 2-phospho-L-lactate transferase [Terriglobales bacterium]|nr:2-phospho-L-lactate transferase [Terriglobales bacterium]
MIAVLTGGTGGAKFLQGVVRAVPPRQVTAIVNTGDDVVWWGLNISPDIDSVMYGLAGLLSRERGWGLEGDTFACLEHMRELGEPSWFQLGDRDLATHVRRTGMLRSGKTLTAVTAELAASFGVSSRLLPMTDDRVETRVLTARGELSFQEYFVREKWKVPVRKVRFAGAETARPTFEVLRAIASAEVIVIAPSNPITSIGPILAVPGIREALRSSPAQKVAVSPIISGKAFSGPADQLMVAHGFPATVAGVAAIYREFLSTLVIDHADAASVSEIEALGLRAVCASTLMNSEDAKRDLAAVCLAAGRSHTRAATNL